MFKYTFLVLTFFVSIELLAGGGWPIGKRKVYAKLGQNSIAAKNIYGQDGKVTALTPGAAIYTTSVYAEYGISNQLTAVAFFPFFTRVVRNELLLQPTGRREPGEALNAIGDFDIALKYTLPLKSKLVVSAALQLGIPVGETAGGESGVLQSGDGEFNQLLRTDFSYSFYPKPVYTTFYAGINNRNSGFSDEYRFGAEGGITLFKQLIIIGRINFVQSFFNGDKALPANGLFSNNTEFVSPEIEVAWQFSKQLGVSFCYAGAFSARNILAAPNIGFGIFYKSK